MPLITKIEKIDLESIDKFQIGFVQMKKDN